MEKQEIKKEKFKFIDLFAGIGGIRLAFEHVGGVCVFSSEWDDNACKTYKANFGDQPYGDITKIEAKDIALSKHIFIRALQISIVNYHRHSINVYLPHEKRLTLKNLLICFGLKQV